MAREIKDEQNMAETPIEGNPSTPPSSLTAPSIQLPISPEMQKAIVEIVMEDYRAAESARSEMKWGKTSKGEELDFEKWLKAVRDIYTGEREPKEIPWKYCSNRSLKIGAAILDLLHSRLYPSIVSEDLLRWRPGEITDVPKVERISKLMTWWLWVRSSMRQVFDIWTKLTIGYGDTLTESFWKVEYTDRGDVEERVVDPLTGQPSVSIRRDIRMEESTSSKVYLRDQFFLQKGSRDIKSEPVILKDEFLYRELEDGEREGKFLNVSTELRDKIPFKPPISMGNIPEEDLEKLKSVKLRNMPVTILKAYFNFDVNGDGFAERVRVIVNPDHEIYLGGVLVKDLTKSGKDPLDFTKFDNRIMNYDENWGEGVLEKIRELAEEIDAIFNQMTDANTLSIMRPGFYDPGGDVDAPALKIAPNKLTPVSAPNQNLFFPEINIPTDKLILAIRLVLEFVERLTAASSYVLGKESEIVGGSGTATRTNAIVQSAEQRFSIFAERLREGASRIVTQHLDLLQLNIPPGLENRILGEDFKPIFGENELTADGISGKFDAYLLLDPTLGSKQAERDLASMFYSILLQNIIVGTDPVKIYKVTADFLKAYGKDPEEYLGPEPKMDDIDSPEDENTLIIQGDFARVKAQIAENHLLHIKVHQDLMMSPSLQALQLTAPNLYQEAITFLQQHIMEHQQMMQTLQSLITKFGGRSNGNTSGNEGREGGVSSGADGSPRMENLPGPLGDALNSKRKGESSSSSYE